MEPFNKMWTKNKKESNQLNADNNNNWYWWIQWTIGQCEQMYENRSLTKNYNTITYTKVT